MLIVVLTYAESGVAVKGGRHLLVGGVSGSGGGHERVERGEWAIDAGENYELHTVFHHVGYLCVGERSAFAITIKT